MADLTVVPGTSGDGEAGRVADLTPGAEASPHAPIDPRAVRLDLGPTSRLTDSAPIVIAPPGAPLEAHPSAVGRGILGGQAAMSPGGPPRPVDETPVTDLAPAGSADVVVDGQPAALRLVRRDAIRAVLITGEGTAARRATILFTGSPTTGDDGIARREVVVDGWRIDVELETERRAALRERARRGHEASGHGGPTEVRAIIPGRVVAISIEPGDAVAAGQQILVVEAMKMQNELRAPRDGTVQRVGVSLGATIEVGDLLLVIE